MLDLNTKKIKKNAFRITKHRGTTSLRVRIPGGELDADIMPILHDIAKKYGDGKMHITIRQGFEITGIRFEDMPEVNKMIEIGKGGKRKKRRPLRGSAFRSWQVNGIQQVAGGRECRSCRFVSNRARRRSECARRDGGS